MPLSGREPAASDSTNSEVKGGGMIFEYRRYEVSPGYLPELHKAFVEKTIPFFDKHGIKPIGFWESLIGTTNELHYIIPWESLADREKRWTEFQFDPDRRLPLKPDGLPVTDRIVNQIWIPTPYSVLK